MSDQQSESPDDRRAKRRQNIHDRLGSLIEENRMLTLLTQDDADEIQKLRVELEATYMEKKRLQNTCDTQDTLVKQLQEQVFHLEHCKFVADVQAKTIEQQDKSMKELIEENKLLTSQCEMDAQSVRVLQQQVHETQLERDRLATRVGKAVQRKTEAEAEVKMMLEHADELRQSNVKLAARLAELEDLVRTFEAEDYADFFTRISKRDIEAGKLRNSEVQLIHMRRSLPTPPEGLSRTQREALAASSGVDPDILEDAQRQLQPTTRTVSEARAFHEQQRLRDQQQQQQQEESPSRKGGPKKFSAAGLSANFGISPKKATTTNGEVGQREGSGSPQPAHPSPLRGSKEFADFPEGFSKAVASNEARLQQQQHSQQQRSLSSHNNNSNSSSGATPSAHDLPLPKSLQHLMAHQQQQQQQSETGRKNASHSMGNGAAPSLVPSSSSPPRRLHEDDEGGEKQQFGNPASPMKGGGPPPPPAAATAALFGSMTEAPTNSAALHARAGKPTLQRGSLQVRDALSGSLVAELSPVQQTSSSQKVDATHTSSTGSTSLRSRVSPRVLEGEEAAEGTVGPLEEPVEDGDDDLDSPSHTMDRNTVLQHTLDTLRRHNELVDELSGASAPRGSNHHHHVQPTVKQPMAQGNHPHPSSFAAAKEPPQYTTIMKPTFRTARAIREEATASNPSSKATQLKPLPQELQPSMSGGRLGPAASNGILLPTSYRVDGSTAIVVTSGASGQPASLPPLLHHPPSMLEKMQRHHGSSQPHTNAALQQQQQQQSSHLLASPGDRAQRPSTSPLLIEAIYGERGNSADETEHMYLVKYQSVEAEQWTSGQFVDMNSDAMHRWRRARAKAQALGR